MIEAKELRIGNLIIGCNELIGTVFNINQSTLRYHVDNELEDIYDEYENIRPIPLTKEWLINLGFQDDGGGYYTHQESLFFREHELYYETSINGYDKGWIIQSLLGGMHGLIYVHQLQNFYHALTNEELTIHETKTQSN